MTVGRPTIVTVTLSSPMRALNVPVTGLSLSSDSGSAWRRGTVWLGPGGRDLSANDSGNEEMEQ